MWYTEFILTKGVLRHNAKWNCIKCIKNIIKSLDVHIKQHKQHNRQYRAFHGQNNGLKVFSHLAQIFQSTGPILGSFTEEVGLYSQKWIPSELSQKAQWKRLCPITVPQASAAESPREKNCLRVGENLCMQKRVDSTVFYAVWVAVPRDVVGLIHVS